MRCSPTTLHRIAGLVWLAVGLSLGARGLDMLFVKARAAGSSSLVIASAVLLGLVLGAAKGWYVLRNSARKNKRRIVALPAPRLWNVFSGTMALLILLMIGFGAGLRALARAEVLAWSGVGGLYVGIGAALLASAVVYFLPEPPTLVTRPAQDVQPTPTKRGLLVINLGTPAAPTTGAVRRYLRQFLGDRRVVELPRILWAVILNGIVLPLRSPRSAEAYRIVWTAEGSPLAFHTNAIARAVATELGADWQVAVGMRYGSPSLGAALAELREAGCEPIRVLPLFPQYSNTTTGTAVAELARIAFAGRTQPTLQFVAPFYSDPDYLRALADSVRRSAANGPAPDHYVFSFHGLPEDYVRRGDPYLAHCQATASLLASELGLRQDQWELAFQSRFGSEPWLQPYIDELVPALAADKPRVLVVAPGFAADCLETIEELGVRLAADFEAAGGRELRLVPCLNADPAFVTALARLARGSA